MGIDVKKANKDLAAFWEEAMELSKEDRERKDTLDDFMALAPSPKLALAVKELGSCEKVLDYGCGTGWASIIANRSGCLNVTAVDLGEKTIEHLLFQCDRYKAKVDAKVIPFDYLREVESSSFDGLVCSNVLDVSPLETAKELIGEFARILTLDAKIVIGLNFFMDEEMAKSRGIELKEGKYLFQNGVLRLTSLEDEKWKELFYPYFDLVSLEHFAWPNEKRETRRLFRLRKKAN
ncbi:MAG: class I SAM-dependent methyltransferase [Bacilli bacterium]|nr:class I SAM-dependent methyltransferase [Bacilli bacterium]